MIWQLVTSLGPNTKEKKDSLFNPTVLEGNIKEGLTKDMVVEEDATKDVGGDMGTHGACTMDTASDTVADKNPYVVMNKDPTQYE